MTIIKDHERCDYFPFRSENLLAVGWLGRGADYDEGALDGEFLDKLRSLMVNAWQPGVFLGLHQCDLCQSNGPVFGRNLFVPHAGKIYVAPEGVLHYIEAHWYQPPDEFIAAVEACPEMNSMAYKKAILETAAVRWCGRLRIVDLPPSDACAESNELT